MGIIVILATIILVSCKKTETTLSNYEKGYPKTANVSIQGQLHNSFLTHFKNEFEINPSIKSVEQGIDYICQFYADSTGMYFKATKHAHTIGIIDDFEYKKLDYIGQIVKENYHGIISNEDLKEIIISINNDMKEYYGSKNSNNGQALAYTISISLYSIEWWEENPDAFGDDNSLKVLPAWVGADIAGAAYGAIVAGTGSYITTGFVNWGAVGISAGAGAISGSTGIIGKAGKWLTSLLK